MAMSVDAVHFQGRKKSAGPVAPQQRRQHRRDSSRGRLSQTREITAASPLLRLRASEGRRAKPTLRREKVATMRSVDGWVRETDPASTRRQVSLDRREVALRKRRDTKTSDKGKETRPPRNSGDPKRRTSSFGGGSTFMTEVELDGVLPVPEAGRSPGSGGIESWGNGGDVRRRRSSVKAHLRIGGAGTSCRIAQRQQARKRSTGMGRAGPPTKVRTRRAIESANMVGRGKFEGAPVEAGFGRTKSVGALDRYGEHQASRREKGQSSVRSGACERQQEHRVGQASAPAPAPLQRPEISGEVNAGCVLAGNSADWIPRDRGEAWKNLPSPGGAADCGEAAVRRPHALRHHVGAQLWTSLT